ncbi:toprim domain-containing protein [Actinocorallia aurantiaca]|uniref:DNA primase n=1 Tax=Actinocorallia aurantiaca TaxID=46204 RepID=A0ABN3UEX8_9ACTN
MRDDLAELLEIIARQELGRLHRGELPWSTVLERATSYGQYGFTNVLLIGAQREATQVKSFEEWQQAGRRIRKGEHAIRILSRQGKPRSVFDLAQTTGPSLEPAPPLSPAQAWEQLRRVAVTRRLYVDRGHQWNYLGDPRLRITIDPDADDTEASFALAHQLAHQVLHRSEFDQMGRECVGVGRVEADAVAFLVTRSLGLAPSRTGNRDVSSWAGNDQRARPLLAIKEVGSRILRAASLLQRQLHEQSKATAQKTETAERRPEASPREQQSEGASTEVHDALEAAHAFFRSQLPSSWAPEYLADRGFPVKVQEQWQAGYAPAGWRNLLNTLTGQGHTPDVLLAAGLVRAKNGRLYDLFRDRITLPVRDPQGRVVGFIGRAAPGSEAPKYLNSPETALFKKGHLLYGLHEVQEKLTSGARPVIVEGAFDVWAVNLASDAHAAIAPSGVAFTAEQLDLLAHAVDLTGAGPLIALDGDPAGRRGAARAWKVLSQLKGTVGAVCFPEQQDPAEILIRQGHAGVREALKAERPLADLAIDVAIEHAEALATSMEARLAAARVAAEIIARLPPAQVSQRVARVCDRLGLDHRDMTGYVVAAVSPVAQASETFPLPPDPTTARPATPFRPVRQPRTPRRSP